MTELALLKVSKSVEDFSVDFHKNVSKEFELDNMVSSALSAHAVLTMAALGADGETAREMQKSLHLSDNRVDTCQGFNALIDAFNVKCSRCNLKIANKMCVSDGISIKEEFKSLTSRFFYSDSIELDFLQIQKSVGLINQWCVKNTEGKIEQIVDADSLNKHTGLLLLNAVYFKGNWKRKFSESLTEMKPFHVNRAKTIDVPTMFTRNTFFYEELNDVKATCVALPYENEDLAMVIVIPNDIDGLRAVEKNLNKIKIAYEKLNENKREMNLMLPKFKIVTNIELKRPLEEMGFSTIFSNKSNFKNISNQPMQVGYVIQNAFIEVNEEGTEAVAITGLMCHNRSIRKRPIIDVTVDRPFLYQIVDIKHKVTLFSGHVVDPNSSKKI